jgi:membrane-associated protein
MDFLIDFLLHVDQHLMEFMQAYHQWTYVLLFLIVFCETGLVVLPFLPGDSLLFVSGAMASLPGTPLHISLLLPVLFAAAVLGDSCNYLLGQHFGEKLFNRPDSRLFRQNHLEKTHAFFQQHGKKAVLIARFVPVVRTFTPFVAGMGRMHYSSFMGYNVAGATVWVLLCCLSGYFFGNLPFIQEHLNLLLYGIVLVSLSPALIEFLRIKIKLR